MSNYQMQKDFGMVFEQVVYLYSESGKAGFQIWCSSDPLVFPTPPHKIGSVTWSCKRKKGRKEREESEIIHLWT